MPNTDALPNPQNAYFVEALYQDYLSDPDSVPDVWRAYFERLGTESAAAPVVGPPFGYRSLFHQPRLRDGVGLDRELLVKQDAVNRLIDAYRRLGHLKAQIDPLEMRAIEVPELQLEHHGLTEDDLDQSFSAAGLFGSELRPLRDIVERLEQSYCQRIGIQYAHIEDSHARNWVQRRVEHPIDDDYITPSAQREILRCLTAAATFEEFLQKRYVGAKSFSLEGAEMLIALLWLTIETAAEQGTEEVVMGMAHRGRLNVLANVIGKSPSQIFLEFEGRSSHHGDVNYHLGFSADRRVQTGGKVHLSLCFNPSHLEFVDPIVLGRVRAKQDRNADFERRKSMAIVIHGDAAIAGEGVVQETFNLSQLEPYWCGGALHVVVNNQIGFTTPPEQGRSSVYATDVAKMLQIPILHVNSQFPDAVARAVRFAMDFRYEFQRDVVIDLYCYRRLGHNEHDEPRFTQPGMYRAIAEVTPVRQRYLDKLLSEGVITKEEAERLVSDAVVHLEQEYAKAQAGEAHPLEQAPRGVWSGYRGGRVPDEEPDARIELELASTLLNATTNVPDGFTLHRTLVKAMERRREMAEGQRPLDWAAAEALAFASLAREGVPVRLTGQDSERGTFSQRHSVLHDMETGETYRPLQHISPDQAPIEITNSPLSEAGVLGFEYGYSQDRPNGLVLWEAQFGDFANAAQVVIDQFIASAESKWQRLSGLVLLLPHGYEGMGPEHSSARLERVLNLAVEDNIQVVYPILPAQYFHLLRRQALWKWRKPLIVLTPKSLLRHPQSTSPLSAITEEGWRPVVSHTPDLDGVRRLLLCTGKVYFDLVARMQQVENAKVAIVSIAQLYPKLDKTLRDIVSSYPEGTEIVWVQEEPLNMGAWQFVARVWRSTFPDRELIHRISRKPSASPATGSKKTHEKEQEQILAAAIGD